MTNNELADLLEEAARRLRSLESLQNPPPAKPKHSVYGLSIEEAAKLLGLKPWTVRKKARIGKIDAAKVHGDWDISEKAIDLYLRVQRSKGANRSLRSSMKAGLA